jgi:hypothetical protein
VVIKEQNGEYVVKLGAFGEQANRDVIYKSIWFYQHLTRVIHASKHNQMIAELYPTHQGRSEKLLERTNELNAFGFFTDISTREVQGDELEVQIVGNLRLAGPHARLVQSMFQNDPEGSTWEFQMRALIDKERFTGKLDQNRRPINYKSLIPQVTKVITWDLHRRFD